jgi:AcrR family transcriptional regulator
MKKTEETEHRIIEAAFVLMKKNGFATTSVKQICAKAKISYSTFYYYFPAKDDIIKSFFSRFFLMTEEDFSLILSAVSPWEKLWTAHLIYFKKIEEFGPDFCAQHFKNLLNPAGDKSGYGFLGNEYVLEPLIKQAQAAGEIKHTGDSMDLYRYSFYLIRGIFLTWCSQPDGMNLIEEMKKALEVFYIVRDGLRSCYA